MELPRCSVARGNMNMDSEVQRKRRSLRSIRNDVILVKKAMNPVRKLVKGNGTLTLVNGFHFF